ncbi:MAG TPA: M48 family metallopeptidase [Blastocatellia bacterium]|nr:M48 family metallopeptidase [Blastocatellia bacterium]
MSQRSNFARFILLLILIVSSGQMLCAQEPPSSASTSQATVNQPKDDNQVQSYQLSPEKYQKAVQYSRIRNIFYFASYGYLLLILIVVLAVRLGPKYRNIAERASSRRFSQAIIFVPLLLFTIDVLSLPLEAYQHTFALKYDQSIQGWPSWIWDWAKGEIIGLIILTLAIWVLFAIIRHSPRRWWFYFWLIVLPFMLLGIFATPVVIDPLFNKFTPLQDSNPGLVTDIEKLTNRAGLQIPRDHIFEMAASEKTQTINAYVTGIGSTKRIVIWDTTIKQMTPPEVLFVVGHEMGHYVLGHIPKGILFTSVSLLLLLFIGYHIINWALAHWGGRWEIREIGDWAALPLMMLILSVILFFAQPIFNTFSRYLEHQADIYGLEVTHGITPNSNQVAAQAFQILGETYLEEPNPSPIIKVWLYNHPPIGERVSFAATYNPWSKGESPQFVK